MSDVVGGGASCGANAGAFSKPTRPAFSTIVAVDDDGMLTTTWCNGVGGGGVSSSAGPGIGIGIGIGIGAEPSSIVTTGMGGSSAAAFASLALPVLGRMSVRPWIPVGDERDWRSIDGSADLPCFSPSAWAAAQTSASRSPGTTTSPR